MLKIIQVTEVTVSRTNYYQDDNEIPTLRNKQVDSYSIQTVIDDNQELYNVDVGFQNKFLAIKEIIK